jgi:hypothetical protein
MCFSSDSGHFDQNDFDHFDQNDYDSCVLTAQVDNTKAFCTIEDKGVDEMATP